MALDIFKNYPLKDHSDPVEASGAVQSLKRDQITANLQGNALQQTKGKVAQLWCELMTAEKEDRSPRQQLLLMYSIGNQEYKCIEGLL